MRSQQRCAEIHDGRVADAGRVIRRVLTCQRPDPGANRGPRGVDRGEGLDRMGGEGTAPALIGHSPSPNSVDLNTDGYR